MTPSRFQVPPPSAGEAVMVSAGPPVAGTFLSEPASKAMKRLSGDQKGAQASSVPGSGCAVGESKSRSQSWERPLASTATNATLLPSGDTLKKLGPLPSGGKVPFTGGVTEKWTALTAAEGRRK